MRPITHTQHKNHPGFTLLEIAIVLVVIGLVVGAVLYGKDLITIALVRAQIGQIEKYQQAVTAFELKYDYLPGDIPDPEASKIGFKARGTYPGEGDGNGIIEGNYGGNCNTCNFGSVQGSGGETNLFWEDLSGGNGVNTNYIDGNFSVGPATCCINAPVYLAGSALIISQFLPAAKIAGGNFVYVFSAFKDTNYFGIAKLSYIAGSSIGSPPVGSAAGLTVAQAYAIDKKIDDGFPQTGNVTAQYDHDYWFSGPIPWIGASDTSPTVASNNTCYDNGNVAGVVQQYSMEIDSGRNITCVLAFPFQLH